MKTKLALVALLLCTVIGMDNIEAKRIYVKQKGDTQAWANINLPDVVIEVEIDFFLECFKTATVQPADEIWIAKGEYLSTGNINLKNDNAIAQAKNVKVYGGFLGTETSIDQRIKTDRDNNEIVEPWEFKHETLLHRRGVELVNNNNRFVSVESAESLVDGLTMCDSRTSVGNGAGANVIPNGAMIRNCTFRNIHLDRSGLAVAKTERVHGGGVYVRYGGIENSLIENCSVTNQAQDGTDLGSIYLAQGGGLSIDNNNNSNANVKFAVENVVVRDCAAKSTRPESAFGGGVFANIGVKKYIRNMIVNNCHSDYRGGGIYVDAGGIYLSHSTITNNKADEGGGIYVGKACEIINVAFYNNEKMAGGLDNLNLGIIPGAESKYIWGFATNGGNSNMELNEIGTEAGEVSLSANDFVRTTTFAGLATSDEQKKEIARAIWYTNSSSHLINTGIMDDGNIGDHFPLTDIRGIGRPKSGINDIGAYEFDQAMTTSLSIPVIANHTIFAVGNTISIKGISSLAEISCYNMNGLLIADITATKHCSVKVDGKGLYVVSVRENGKVTTAKVFVE